MFKPHFTKLLLGLLLLGSSQVNRAAACDNPVFRYALQNWRAAEYELQRVRSVEPSAEETSAWGELQAVVAAEPRPNLLLREVASGEPAAANSLVLMTPTRADGARQVWSGACTAENVERLLRSPARQELAKRLLDGEAIIWIVLKTKESAANESARSTLETFLTGYAETLALADAQTAAAASGREPIPGTEPPPPPADKAQFWPPRFSLLELDPEDPRETLLVAMLLSALEGASANEPVVFPVFGQGRVLGGMPISQVNPVSLRSACDFLTGACSCEAKEKNPGDDLLMIANWASVAKKQESLGMLSLLELEPEPAAPSPAPADAKETPEEPMSSPPEVTPSEVTPSSATPSSPQSNSTSSATPPSINPRWIAIVGLGVLLVIGYLVLRATA